MSGKHAEPNDVSLEALKAGTNSRRSAVAQERIAAAFERIAAAIEPVMGLAVRALERDRLREEAYEATQRAASAPGDRVPTEAEVGVV